MSEDQCVSVETSELSDEQLEAGICELAGHLWSAECRWLLMIGEFDRRDGWGAWGVRSCAHWLAWRCGVGLGAAREKVRVARRLPDLPAITGSFSRGELSYAKVRALTRVARPENEEQLLDLARHATTPQLEKILAAWRSARGPEEIDEANDRHDRRSATWYHDDDGSLVISARLSPEDGAVLLAALDAARHAPALPGNVSTETDPAAATNADALAVVARAALVGLAGSGPVPEAYQVVVHVDAATLTGADPDGRCHLEDGPALAPETARRLTCDVAITTMVEAGGATVDVGRRTRSIPPALRRAVRHRDHGCRYPSCTNRRFLHGHHVVHWADGGETNQDNIVSLCGPHHRLHHEGGYRIRCPHPGSFAFIRADGQPIPDAPPSPPVSGPSLNDQHRAAGLTIDPHTCRSLSEGEPYDLDLTIDALLTGCR